MFLPNHMASFDISVAIHNTTHFRAFKLTKNKMSDMKRNQSPDDAQSNDIDTSVAQRKTKRRKGQDHLHQFFDGSWLHDSSFAALLKVDQSDPVVGILDSRKKLIGVIHDQQIMIHDLTKSIVVCAKIRAQLLEEVNTLLQTLNTQVQQSKSEILQATEAHEKLAQNVRATMKTLTYIESTTMRVGEGISDLITQASTIPKL
jgi:hypothetical protein